MRRTGRAFGRKGPVREGKPYRERPVHIPLSEDLGKDILQDAARQIVFFFNRRINADDDRHVKCFRIRGLYAQGDLLARSDAVVQAQDGEGGVLQRSDAVIIRLVGEVEGQVSATFDTPLR